MWTISKALLTAFADFGSSHYSLAAAAESSEASSLAGELLQLLSGNRTRQVFLFGAKTTDTSHLSLFGMTSKPLTDDLGAAVLTWCLEASRAKTSALPAKVQGSPVLAVDYGRRWRALSMRYNRDSCLWKTRPSLWDEGWTSSLGTLPRWGLMRDGELWERVTLVRRTSETAYGSLPTPVKYDSHGTWESNNYHGLGWKARHEWSKQDQECAALEAMGIEPSKQAREGIWPTPVASAGGLRGGSGVPVDLKARLNLQKRPVIWPTPVKNESRAAGYTVETSRRHFLEGSHQVHLAQAVRDPIMYPTPTCTQPKMPTATLIDRMHDKQHEGNTSVPLVEVLQRRKLAETHPTPTLQGLRGGSQTPHFPGKWGTPDDIDYGDLNPAWVEWLMGWPIGWTGVAPMSVDDMEDWKLRITCQEGQDKNTWWLADPSDDERTGITKTVPAIKGISEERRVARISALGNGQASAVIPAVLYILLNMTPPTNQEL
jgi:hypothetical protein